MLNAKSGVVVVLAAVLGFSMLAGQAYAQCGGPDPNQVVLNDADIWHVSGGDIFTVIPDPFPDNSLIGDWIAVRRYVDLPIEYYQIIGNMYYEQGDLSVFTVAENIEGDGVWWKYYERRFFDILAPVPCISCEFDTDCDDGDGCTVDTCNVDDEICEFAPLDCDDDNACTLDSCADGACVNAPISCDDGNACTIDSCDAETGCVHEPVDCDDGDPCTADSCAAGVCSNDPICGPADGCCDPSCDPGSDPDCFVCGERWDYCTQNSDCCSNKCRGHRCR
ncbi:MAG TPA: hypothetical protein P5572_18625 [Phycisphaerae bacterium]|nr:hypothetical protein [Phycisphaerales bacterium]HRX87044.1 hypothetical protein [Phycisphaerae bacterium]